MQTLGIILSLVLLASCASRFHDPESITSKMARYKSKNLNENLVPKIQVKQTKISKYSTTTRTLASAEESKLPQSNKKFYFLALLGQYYEMASYLPKNVKKQEINFCPHFHSLLVDYEKTPKEYKKTSRLLTHDISWENMKDFDSVKYPELNLPVSETELTPTIVDILQNKDEIKKYKSAKELITHAMNIHTNKTYKELKTLCEYGNSPNYYHYENLLGHIQRKGESFNANSDSIQILLKSTLYSNLTLINSFESYGETAGRIPASSSQSVYENPYSLELLQRFNAPWAVNYLKESK